MNLYEVIMDELQARGCAKVRQYAPFFICSIGSHLLNLHNWKKPFYFEAGLPFDFRSHLFFVAPSGFSKSFWQFQFLLPDIGILHRTKIDHRFVGYMTEAGWVGTIKTINGESVTIPGMAILHKRAILGCEEFSTLAEAMKAQSSRQLDTAMLTSLDRGFIHKRLGAGGIDDQTHATLWAGTQPARFDLTQGLGRRFVFVTYIPTAEDFQLLKTARRAALNKRVNRDRLFVLSKEIDKRMSAVTKIKYLSIEPEVHKEFDKYELLHYEEPLYERLLAGYHIMKEEPSEQLYVTLDNEAKSIIFREVMWRKEIMRGTQFTQILVILKQAPKATMHISKLRDKLLAFGYDWVTSTNLIYDLVRARVLFIKEGYVSLYRRRKLD